MLVIVNLQQRRAAHALSQQSWWPTMLELLKLERAAVHQLMTDTMNPVVLHQLQGRAKSIDEFCELVLTAGSVLAQQERLPSGLGNLKS